MEKSDLDNLKEAFSKIPGKYNLPSFDDLNRDFKIEKIAEVETDFLVREIRDHVSESLVNFARFVEAILNPANVPMFLYPLIKAMDEDDKKKLVDLNEKISTLEIQAMKLINYSEEKEAEFINNAFEFWQEVKKEFSEFVESTEKKIKKDSKKTGKNYFG